MWMHEAEARFNARKEAGLPILQALPRKEKVGWIRKAKAYRSGPDPFNSLYMGSMATHMLYVKLGGRITTHALEDLLEQATEAQLDAALETCFNILEHVPDSPVKGVGA